MSSSHHRRAGKYGEEDDGSGSTFLPNKNLQSKSGESSGGSKEYEESNGSASTPNDSKPIDTATEYSPKRFPPPDTAPAESTPKKFSPELGVASNQASAASLYAHLAIEEDDVSTLTNFSAMPKSPPPLLGELEEEGDTNSKLSTVQSIGSGGNKSFYPDITDLEKQESVPSKQYKEFVEDTKHQVQESAPPPPSGHQESAPPPSSGHPHAQASNLKTWPPPSTTPPSHDASGLSEDEVAAKNRVHAGVMPAATPGAVMVPGVRSSQPWVPNTDEEDPDIKSVAMSTNVLEHTNSDSDEYESSQESDQASALSNDDDDDGVIKATMVEDLHVPEAEAVSENAIKRRRRIIIGIALLIVTGAIVGVAVGLSQRDTRDVLVTPAPTAETESPTASPTATPRPTLETIQEEGVLRCGVVNRIGFSTVNQIDPSKRDGFDIDMCRAVAAAALGNGDALVPVELTSVERFLALANGTVDVLSRVTTHTMSRDVNEVRSQVGFSYVATYLYDGLGFGGIPEFLACADGLTTLGQCIAMRVCLLQGTTHVDVLKVRLPESALIPVATRSDLYQGLSDGTCNVIAAEVFDIATEVVRGGGYSGPYETGNNLLSKEPLAMLVRDRDPEWYDFVSWVFQALLISEEQGITMATAAQIPTTALFGPEYRDMFRNAIAAVGNYGEIYQRHLERITPRNILDTRNDGTTGLIYSFPFGGVANEGPLPREGSTMDEIKERGTVRCGIIRRPGTGDLINQNGEERWEGIDADYCRAVSVALFRGTDAEVLEFVEVTDTDNGLVALSNGEIDVLAGGAVTFERDVSHLATGLGYTFTVPYFYYPSNLPPNPTYGETLSLATLQDDTQWADFVFWIVHATFYAEETQIDQSTAQDMPDVGLFGSLYTNMFQDTIGAVGNYGEIYSRRVESIFPRNATANMLNINPFGPQQYPLPGLSFL